MVLRAQWAMREARISIPSDHTRHHWECSTDGGLVMALLEADAGRKLLTSAFGVLA
jgi:hypothetical protein